MTANRKTILVLEDEPLIAIAMEESIRDFGFSPLVCGAVDEALQILEAGEIAMAILDYKIRNENSEAIALELRRHSIPFIVCSGMDVAPQTEAFAGVPFVSKPFADTHLQAAILAALDG